MTRVRVVCAVIERAGRYLITQRRPTAVLPLMWEFPGGRVEKEEDDTTALEREVQHRLGVDISVNQLMSYITHPYDRYVVDLYLYDCSIIEGTPRPAHVHDFKWVTSAEFERYDFTPADEASMTKLLGLE